MQHELTTELHTILDEIERLCDKHCRAPRQAKTQLYPKLHCTTHTLATQNSAWDGYQHPFLMELFLNLK